MEECLMKDCDGKCLVAKPLEEVISSENIAWDEEGNCRFREAGRINWQKCDNYSEDPYCIISKFAGRKRS